jgi:hypothetical protein
MRNQYSRNIEIEQKINAAMQSLGLTFAEGFRIVRYNPEAKTAHWKYSSATGEEVIELGDLIVDLPVAEIEMVLRHEFLHRSVFHGFGEQFDDPQTSNIALDICINRLLFEAFPKEMKDLSVSVYPKESKTTVIALADCSASPFDLKEPLRALWKSIWERDHNGNYQNLNPASLYFKLLELHDDSDLSMAPFSDFSKIDPEISGNMPDRIVKAGSKVASGVSRKLPSGSAGGEGLDEYSVIPQQIGINNVEQFLQRINAKTIATQFASKIKKPLQKTVHFQPYPLFPTRLGYIYQVFGLTDTLRMYWNQDTTSIGVRMAIGMYVDVSGSMVEHFPLISGFVEALKDFPIKIYAFDTTLKEINIEEFSNGMIRGGGGTDFDCVINNFINDNDMVAAVIFTDGDGTLSEPLARSLKISRKNVYMVYLRSGNGYNCSSVLDKLSRDTMVIEHKDSKYIIVKQEYSWNY